MKIPLPTDIWDGRPRDPVCPAFCRFRLLCTHWHQQGINQLFVDGRIERRATACFPWFEGMTRAIKSRFEIDPEGMTAEELFEAVAERVALQEEIL